MSDNNLPEGTAGRTDRRGRREDAVSNEEFDRDEAFWKAEKLNRIEEEFARACEEVFAIDRQMAALQREREAAMQKSERLYREREQARKESRGVPF